MIRKETIIFNDINNNQVESESEYLSVHEIVVIDKLGEIKEDENPKYLAIENKDICSDELYGYREYPISEDMYKKLLKNSIPKGGYIYQLEYSYSKDDMGLIYYDRYVNIVYPRKLMVKHKLNIIDNKSKFFMDYKTKRYKTEGEISITEQLYKKLKELYV